MAFPMVLFVDFILDVWLVEVPDYAGIFIIFMLCYYLIDALQNPLWQAVHATGQIAVHQILISIIKILNIPIIYVVLRNGGEFWAAIAIWAFMNLIAAIVRTVYLRRLINLDLSFYLKDVLLRVIIVSLTSIIIPILFYLHVGSGWWQLIFITTLFLIILGASIFVFGLNSFERDLLKKTIKQKFNI